jgi:hypothetical protein
MIAPIFIRSETLSLKRNSKKTASVIIALKNVVPNRLDTLDIYSINTLNPLFYIFFNTKNQNSRLYKDEQLTVPKALCFTSVFLENEAY